MDNPLISVIVPAYNAEKSITKCIFSLLRQNIKESYKIIIVNDGSTDDTLTEIKSFKDNPKISIIDKKNEGVSIARNTALKNVNSKFVTFVDSDDFVDSNFLVDLYSGFKDAKDVDLTISGLRKLNTNNKLLEEYKFSNVTRSAEDVISLLLNETGPQGYLWNKMFRTSIIKKYSLLLDPKIFMAEDLLFCIQYLKFSKKVRVSNYCDYNYVQDSNSMNGGLSFTKNNRRYKKIFNNYFFALNKILNEIKNNPKKYSLAIINVKARLAREYSIFLRLLLLNNDKNKKLQKEVYWQAYKLKRYVFKGKSIPVSKKMFFACTIYCPHLVHISDEARFS
jgi:glycosyltransferase involved in cell wall biosynthesis